MTRRCRVLKVGKVYLPEDSLRSEFGRTEAIRRIIGATPAFTRPRQLSVNLIPDYILTRLSAFGSYNDEVLNVAGSRSQTLVNWDLE